MKVIKRNGRAVEYNPEKIGVAIEKANQEVKPNRRATPEEIQKITNYIEDLDKKRILVEDIQDIIEQKLMEFGKFELAKKYIVYRYTRALVRKQNTTDETILGLIKNTIPTQDVAEQKAMVAASQRNLIAGEVSKDLTKRMLLPEKITKAHDEGILYFHDAEYFLQPIFNCCFVNMKDMLAKGTCINGKKIETPKSFQVACTVMTQIIAAVASGQYGGQAIDVSCLGEYLKKSSEKMEAELAEFQANIPKDVFEKIIDKRVKTELKNGIQTILYQISTLLTTNGKLPQVTLFLHVTPNDPFESENVKIIEEILIQYQKGIPNQEGKQEKLESPKLVYVLQEQNCLQGGKYDDLTRLAITCSTKTGSPNYISAKKQAQIYEGLVFPPMGEGHFLTPLKTKEGKQQLHGRFNQGVVTINLPQIAILAKRDEKAFWDLLQERLELCEEALLCRHYALCGTSSEVSPIHWQDGAIARLAKDEKIDDLLKNQYSTLSLGYVGVAETLKQLKQIEMTTKEGHEFALKIIKYLKKTVEMWTNQTGIAFVLYGTVSNKPAKEFLKLDQQNYGTIQGITDKTSYTNSFSLPDHEKISVLERLQLESQLQDVTTGGGAIHIHMPELQENQEAFEKVIQFIYENVMYSKMD